MSKQTTLFQTWGYEGNIPTSQLNQSVGSSVPSSSQKNKGKSRRSIEEEFLQDDDDEDALLIQAMEASMATYEKEKYQSGSPTYKPKPINDPVDFEELPEIPQTQATGDTLYSYHVLVGCDLIDLTFQNNCRDLTWMLEERGSTQPIIQLGNISSTSSRAVYLKTRWFLCQLVLEKLSLLL